MLVIHEAPIVRDFLLRWVEILIESMLDFGQIIGRGSINPDLSTNINELQRKDET